jgi:hypothetical protein
MTRGYVIIVNGTNIEHAMYSNSDSYLSGLGLEVLEEIKKGTLEAYIETYKKENPHYNEDIDGIEMSWIVKDKSSSGGFYVDYAYVYDITKKVLTVYNYGDLAFKIKEDEYEIAEFVFKNDYALYQKWAFDKKKLEYMYDNYKPFRDMLRKKATLSEYEAILEMKVDSFCVESGRFKENFHTSDYCKIIEDIDTEKKLHFLVKRSTFYGEKVDIYLKLPFGNVYLCQSSSDKAADKRVKVFAREDRIELLNVLKLLSILEKYEEMLGKYMFIKKNYTSACENSINQLEEILKEINKFKKENLLLRGRSSVYDEKHIKNYLERLRDKMLHSEDKEETA